MLCPPFDPEAVLETCILAGDGALVTSSFDASVTVVGIDTVDSAVTINACRGTGLTLSSGISTHLELETTDQLRFTLILRMPNLPSEFAAPNDVFELSVFARPAGIAFDPPDQSIRLSRGTDLLLFGAIASRASVNGLDDVGIEVVDEGRWCDSGRLDIFGCLTVHHRTRVSVGAVEASFQPYQTQQLGSYSVTVGSAHDFMGGGTCDAIPFTQVAGVANSL
jgi:hypothetical protein